LFIAISAAIAASVAPVVAARAAEAAGPSGGQVRRPNLVLIMTDDQGCGGRSCRGNPILKTPALETLYEAGVRLTNFHVDRVSRPREH